MPTPITGLRRTTSMSAPSGGSVGSVLEGVLGPRTGENLFYDPQIGMFYLAMLASSPKHYRILQDLMEASEAEGLEPMGFGAKKAMAFPDIWYEDDPFGLAADTIRWDQAFEQVRKRRGY